MDLHELSSRQRYFLQIFTKELDETPKLRCRFEAYNLKLLKAKAKEICDTYTNDQQRDITCFSIITDHPIRIMQANLHFRDGSIQRVSVEFFPRIKRRY